MNIAIIGTGYVGLVTGACFAEFGFNVICVDIDKEKIKKLTKGNIPIYEPGLDSLVKKNIEAKRLSFTDQFEEPIKKSKVIFLCIGTPSNPDGSADLTSILNATEIIGSFIDNYKVIVNKSTVPVGTGKVVKQKIKETINNRGGDIEFDVVSNPEFLREGAAINDFMHPDRIVIGAETEKAMEIMRNVYRVLFLNNHPFVFTDIETAELIKYASNAFLATKITFINEMANLCEAVGGNIKDVAKAMGLDKRIGKFFLHPGPGYGGSCFPKDTKALVNIADKHGIELKITNSVIKANELQKIRMVQKIEKRMGQVFGKKIAVLGIAFKAETDDIREAPAITIVKELISRGARISVYDPEAMGNARKYELNNYDIEYANNEYDAIQDADAIVIITEWNQFRLLDFDRILKIIKGNYFFDLRNIYDKYTIESLGFEYEGVGR